MQKPSRPKIDIFEFQSSAFGEELARLNALPKKQLLKYIGQRQRIFKTPDDLILDKGFPTEYWSSIEEVDDENKKLFFE
jgi:hypothetical protein